jgi:hypothetical protein
MNKFHLSNSIIELEDSQAIGLVSADQYAEMAGGILKSMLQQSVGLDWAAPGVAPKILFKPAGANSYSISNDAMVEAADAMAYKLFLKAHQRSLQKAKN